MFKKPVKVSAQNQLSGKDRKTMKNKLSETFDEGCVDKIFNLNDKIISCKISGSKMIIYNGNDYPIFVDGTGKNDYFPSLYAVMAFEPLLKFVDLNEGVESYIYNGANLMWPGVRDFKGLQNFQKDQVVAIRSAKGQPIAVGAMGCSLKQLQANKDNSGVAVYILHYFNDKLWESGPKTKPQILVAAEKPKKKQQPKIEQVKVEVKQKQVTKAKKQQQPQQKKQNTKKQQAKGKKNEDEQKQEKLKQKKKEKEEQKGKGKKQKKKQSSEQKAKQKSEKEDSSDGQADFSNLVHSKQSKPTHAQVQKVEKKGQAHNVFSDEQQNDKKGKKKANKKEAKKQAKKQVKKKSDDEDDNSEGGQQKKQAQQEQKSAVSSKLMDQQFKQAFLNTLKLSKVEGELPIDSGRFFMDFMLLARPPGVKLQIKDTSYKKLGKFYEQMSKQKFIQFKHNKDKKGQQGSSIVKIMWDNQQLKNYEPTILRMNQKDIEQKQEAGESKKKLKLTSTLSVQTAYKLHPNFKNAVFAKRVNYAPTQQQQKQMKKEQQEVKNQPEFYTEQQVRVLIEKYINDKLVPKKNKQDKEKEKQKKTDKMVSIDYKHNDYLAELLKKQIEEYEENAEGDKDVDSADEEEAKKTKKKKENIMKMDRGALVNRILKTCSTSYHMRDKETNFQAFMQGTFKGIQLVAEKSNNKNITKIVGLETFIVPKSEAEEQINWLANTLKQKFACSVNIQNLPGRNAGKEIIVHGNFINELEEMFVQEYKINQDYITSQNKLDKKKKR